jgi:hypothetical protein
VSHIVKGRARMRWGGHLEFTAEARRGDFTCVQPEQVLWIEETQQKGSPQAALPQVPVALVPMYYPERVEVHPVGRDRVAHLVDPIVAVLVSLRCGGRSPGQ